MRILNADRTQDVKIYSILPTILLVKEKKRKTLILTMYRLWIILWERKV